MKILIAGHKGMLGSALANVFKGEELVLWDLPEVDVADESILDQMVAENPELVINATGYTAVDMAEKKKKEAKRGNITTVEMLAEACAKINSPLVHFSTDYVFDGETKTGYKENDQPKPISFYGKTKAEAEKTLKKKTDEIFLIRTSGLYGPNGKNFVDAILEKAKTGTPLTIVNDQICKPTYSLDLARAVRELIEMQPEYGTYHLVNEGAVSWYEFAKKIVEFAQLKVDVKPISSKEYKAAAKRPANSTLLNTKMKHLRPWSEALADYLARKQSKA